MQTKTYSIEISPDTVAKFIKYMILYIALAIFIKFSRIIVVDYIVYIAGLFVPVISAGIDNWRERRANKRKQLGIIHSSLFQRTEFLSRTL